MGDRKCSVKNKGSSIHIYFNSRRRRERDQLNFADDLKYTLVIKDIKKKLKGDSRYVVLPNAQEPKNSYRFITGYISRIIENQGFLCKNINSEYIEESIEDADVAIVVGAKEASTIFPNQAIFGFALLSFNSEDKYIYINIICSHIGVGGCGNVLIDAIEDISRLVSMPEIHLHSVPSAVGFYKNKGFKAEAKNCPPLRSEADLEGLVPAWMLAIRPPSTTCDMTMIKNTIDSKKGGKATMISLRKRVRKRRKTKRRRTKKSRRANKKRRMTRKGK